MMTREDMLRELELLPVWQLRVPLPSQAEVPQAEFMQMTPAVLVAEAEPGLPMNIKQVGPRVGTQVEAVVEVQVEPQIIKPQVFTHIASEDGDWLFVLPNTGLQKTVPQADEERLLQNICMAMRIKAKPAEMSANTADVINATQPKLLVAMGEVTAQSMLQSTETLASLRGTLQQFQGVAMVVTYDLAHLLQNLPDKVKALDDLCLAMQVLQDFKL